MAGERDRNFRRGDLAEQLGILLLQGLSAVAPVPRTEDMGVDVVATLLRPEGSRRLIAENSFYVQLKAVSIRTVEYCTGEVSWLRSLELPFFIGSVDLGAGTLQLFASHEINRLIAERVPLDNSDRLKLFLAAGKPTGFDGPGERNIHIGPPILSIGLADLSDPQFIDRAYLVLKQHLIIMRTNKVSAQSGFYQEVEWQTNEQPVSTIPSQSCGLIDPFHQLLDANWRIIHSWYFHLRALGHRSEADQLYHLFERMGELGWTIPDAASLIKTFKTIEKALPSHDWFRGREVHIMDAGLRRRSQSTQDSDGSIV